ncbi:MAG TPA: hypothetical protein VLB29_07360 [Nocardioidaceae bacterium]|nr:hypothetical protein [Nocardioidaceae bacterium]
MTAVANTVFSAAQFNQFVRDNLNETAPAKATAAGSHFVATGVNSIAERQTQGATDLNNADTTSTTFTDLSAPGAIGPSVTVETGPSALVVVQCQLSNDGAGSSRMAYAVSGATTIAAADNRGTGIFGSAGVALIASSVSLHFGGVALTPGINTFTAKYRVSSGTGTFTQRRIIVFPL